MFHEKIFLPAIPCYVSNFRDTRLRLSLNHVSDHNARYSTPCCMLYIIAVFILPVVFTMSQFVYYQTLIPIFSVLLRLSLSLSHPRPPKTCACISIAYPFHVLKAFLNEKYIILIKKGLTDCLLIV